MNTHFALARLVWSVDTVVCPYGCVGVPDTLSSRALSD